ncbi:hypothetical protein [Winogradskyella sp.]|uniref:hypothetical protein n=1 Tax=Winogradskyella sp. TaxID=1883156 RepID=UPI00262262AF|nr:hypothetical protein [Winogradskyella sp.]
MGKIRIERHTGWIGQLVGIEIYIDGKKIGTINYGETQEYDVEYGKHEVYAKLGWERSKKIELNILESETKILKLTLYKYGILILLIVFGLQALYLITKDTLNLELKHYFIALAIVILHPLYYMLKKKTVLLTEIDEKTSYSNA